MTKYTVTTKSQREILATFKAIFKDVKPAHAPKPVTLEERLEPYRKAVQIQRERGMDWEQIAVGMADARLGEKVTGTMLKRVLGRARKPAADVPEKPQPRRLVIDPATGQPVPPVAPLPVPPMTPKEHTQWDEILKQLIPTIVNTAMPRNDAQSYTKLVTERMKPADTARFHAIVESELEAMSEATSAQYGIQPEAFTKWRRRWARG